MGRSCACTCANVMEGALVAQTDELDTLQTSATAQADTNRASDKIHSFKIGGVIQVLQDLQKAPQNQQTADEINDLVAASVNEDERRKLRMQCAAIKHRAAKFALHTSQ